MCSPATVVRDVAYCLARRRALARVPLFWCGPFCAVCAPWLTRVVVRPQSSCETSRFLSCNSSQFCRVRHCFFITWNVAAVVRGHVFAVVDVVESSVRAVDSSCDIRSVSPRCGLVANTFKYLQNTRILMSLTHRLSSGSNSQVRPVGTRDWHHCGRSSRRWMVTACGNSCWYRLVFFCFVYQ